METDGQSFQVRVKPWSVCPRARAATTDHDPAGDECGDAVP
jgi:hypothetical protein